MGGETQRVHEHERESERVSVRVRRSLKARTWNQLGARDIEQEHKINGGREREIVGRETRRTATTTQTKRERERERER